MQGTFKSYSGTVELDRRSLAPVSVNLTIDPTQMALQGSQVTADSFQTPGLNKIYYKSTSIRALGKDSYKVSGIARSGSDSYALDLTVTNVTRSATQTFCRFIVRGAVPSMQNLGLLGGTESSGSLEGKLTFTTSGRPAARREQANSR